MFSRQSRLRKERDIMRVYKIGRGVSDANMSIKALKSGLTQNRTVVVVSKKVDKRAVVRNKNRRRIASIVRNLGETYLAGYDIVVTVRCDMTQLDHAQIEANIQQLFKRLASK